MKANRKDRERARYWRPLVRARLIAKTPEQREAQVRDTLRQHPQFTEAQVREALDLSESEIRETWGNDQYLVHVIHWPPMRINGEDRAVVQLSIRRQDRGAARDWRDFQRIKNQLVGPECEAIELYPAESRLADSANQFHLWCVADPSFRFPFGWTERLVSEGSAGGSKQRPFDPFDEIPAAGETQ